MVLIVAMVLFPPWNYTTWDVGRRSGGAPPDGVVIPEVRIVRTTYASLFRPPRLAGARLNVGRLAAQCALVAGLAMGAMFVRR